MANNKTIIDSLTTLTDAIKGIVTSQGTILKEIKALRKENEELKALLSADNGDIKESKATPAPSKSKKSTSTKSSKKAEKKDEVVERCYVYATRRLEKDEFTKVYAIVKKYNGRIKNSDKKDENGHKLALWTFSVEDGKKFADEVVKSKVFGRKKIALESKMVTLKAN